MCPPNKKVTFKYEKSEEGWEEKNDEAGDHFGWKLSKKIKTWLLSHSFILVIVLSLHKFLYWMLGYPTCYKKSEIKVILLFSSSGHQIVSSIYNSKRKWEKGLIAGTIELNSYADTIVAGEIVVLSTT